MQDRSVAQSIARAMQNEFSGGASPLMQSLLENWSEDTDTGILEQILGSMTSRDECKVAQQALRQLREMRQGHKSDRGAGRQQTLMQAWAKAVGDPMGATSSRDLDDPDTAYIRHQLLGLREGWKEFGEQGRWAIVELLVGSLSAEVLQRNAQYVAAVYAGVAEDIPPPALLELRINLRKRGLDGQGEGERRSEGSRPKVGQKAAERGAEDHGQGSRWKTGRSGGERSGRAQGRARATRRRRKHGDRSSRTRKHGDRSSRTRRQTNADANLRK